MQLTNMSSPFSRNFHLYSIPDALNLRDLLSDVSARHGIIAGTGNSLAAVLYFAQVFHRGLEVRINMADIHGAANDLPRPRQTIP